jgi:hypothetical protein
LIDCTVLEAHSLEYDQEEVHTAGMKVAEMAEDYAYSHSCALELEDRIQNSSVHIEWRTDSQVLWIDSLKSLWVRGDRDVDKAGRVGVEKVVWLVREQAAVDMRHARKSRYEGWRVLVSMEVGYVMAVAKPRLAMHMERASMHHFEVLRVWRVKTTFEFVLVVEDRAYYLMSAAILEEK